MTRLRCLPLGKFSFPRRRIAAPLALAIVAALAVSDVSPAFAVKAAAASKGRRQAIDLLSLGRQMEDAGKLDEATGYYQQSLQAAPSPAAYYHLGHVLAQLGRKGEAKGAFEQALALNPDFELARLELGQMGGGAGASSAAGGDGINIDRIRRENDTIQSLDVPDNLLVDGAIEPSQPPRYADLVKRQVPAPPSNPGAGSPPQPSQFEPPSGTGGRAYDAAIPPQTAIIENDGPATIMVTGNDQTGERGRSATEADLGEVVLEADGPVARSEDNGGFVPSRVDTAPAAARGGGNRPAAGGMPSVDAINAVAFSPEEAAKPGSTVYGNHSKVFLGTYAFHRDKGDRYREADRWAEAATEYRTALELVPGDVDARTLYAEALARSGQAAEAESQFGKSENMAPNDARVHYRKGNMLREAGKTDQAQGSYIRAVELDGTNKFALNNLGVIYMEKGEYDRAASYFKRVLEVDPNYDKALLNLGIIYDDHLNDDALALQYYDRYLAAGGSRKNEVSRWADALRGQ